MEQNKTIFKYRGKEFCVNGYKGDHIFDKIRKNNIFYEIDLLEYIADFMKNYGKNGICIDVGANIGNHSMFFKCFLKNELICYEPNPPAFKMLKKNLNRSPKIFYFTKSSLNETAIGRNSYTGRISVKNSNNIGGAKIIPGSGDIKIHSIDEQMIDRRNRDKTHSVSLIKIDVEGMDLDVLLGAKDTILCDLPEIFIEAATPYHFKYIERFMRQIYYRPVCKLAATPVYHFTHDPTIYIIIRSKLKQFYFKFKDIFRNIIRTISKNLFF